MQSTELVLDWGSPGSERACPWWLPIPENMLEVQQSRTCIYLLILAGPGIPLVARLSMGGAVIVHRHRLKVLRRKHL